jgi:hypothetical protein
MANLTEKRLRQGRVGWDETLPYPTQADNPLDISQRPGIIPSIVEHSSSHTPRSKTPEHEKAPHAQDPPRQVRSAFTLPPGLCRLISPARWRRCPATA